MNDDNLNKTDSPGYISDIKMPPAGQPVLGNDASISNTQNQPNQPIMPQAEPVQPAAVQPAPAPASVSVDDSQSNTGQFDDIDIINDDNKDALPLPAAFVSSGKPKNKKKLIITLISVVVLVLLAIAGYLLWTNYFSNSSSNNNTEQPVANQEQAKLSNSTDVLAVIDKDYGQHEVASEQFADKANYPSQYITYDEEGRYYIRTPQTWHYYDLGESPQTIVDGGASVCDSNKIDTQYGGFLTLARQSFESAGFAISDPKSGQDLKSGIYTQYNNCGSAFVATSTDETCSVYMLEASDVKDLNNSTPRLVGQVACSDMGVVTPEITKLTQANAILQSVGSAYKLNSQGLDSIEYIKDSQTAGYKIAALFVSASDSIPNYYYQKADAAWQLANEADKPLNCDTTNADLKAAFKGEKCIVRDALSGTDVEATF